ncbi:MAG: class I adenylate cyclase [Desulfobacula sp.]|nr:class I adenylate cyclase [Desulfobacula sp.]
MREAIRYLTPEKFDLFLRIPFLLHINAPNYPGFVQNKSHANGIWNFTASGFYKLAIKENAFPKSIIEYVKIDNPCILALYHIGSLGTFTQSAGSDFDYWVMIDKKQFNHERYANLEKKLDNIKTYCREKYHQKVSFFVMDYKQIVHDDYASFDGEEIITVPKIFLKEEFYRTYLMIAGKIPLWSVMPQNLTDNNERKRIGSQITSIYEDIIDLGQIDTIPFSDIVKGLLWHICKAGADPVKAIIKATLVFSYGFGQQEHQVLLCDKIRSGYADAGIDDYAVDPYKLAFDRILQFHKICDPKGIHLIKNAIFFRLCGYPDVKMPEDNSPKRQLLSHYIHHWKLKDHQVSKLLSYINWAEAEKLLLEKAIVQRMAQMSNLAVKKAGDNSLIHTTDPDKRNWKILKNKTRVRLRGGSCKIEECSTFLKRQNIRQLSIEQTKAAWKLHVCDQAGAISKSIYVHKNFSGVFGWILENHLYQRHTAKMTCKADHQLFETKETKVSMDQLYMSVIPFKPLSDKNFEQDAFWSKLMVFLFFCKNNKEQVLMHAELLALNSWGEIHSDLIEFDDGCARIKKLVLLANKIKSYADNKTRFFIYQFAVQYDSDIVYELKTIVEETVGVSTRSHHHHKKPYLDKL